jgi:hypothetical protein
MKNTKQKKKNFWDNFRFEFILYINEHKTRENKLRPIICQRLFDVRRYNKNVLNSIELKELMDDLTSVSEMGLIPKFLKEKSEKYLWRNYNPYRYYDREPKDNFENEDIFTFEIRVDKRIVAKSMFSGNWFPTEVRYSVNIKEIIPEIIDQIQECFSLDEYETTYGNYDLKIG